jgi:hypothetical protein
MNTGPVLYGHKDTGSRNVECGSRCIHVSRQASAPVVVQLANGVVRLCSHTCRYITKRLTSDSYAGCLQNELPAILENVSLQTHLQMYY